MGNIVRSLVHNEWLQLENDRNLQWKHGLKHHRSTQTKRTNQMQCCKVRATQMAQAHFNAR